MKRLLLPLLAALALPTAVDAETHWLILSYNQWSPEFPSALEKIEMESVEACYKEGNRWINSPTQPSSKRDRSFHCVVGK